MDVAGEGWHDVMLDLYMQDSGADVEVWMTPGNEGGMDSDYYLGTVNTKSVEKARRQIVLRSIELEKGEYTLTFVAEGELWINAVKFTPADAPKLLLEAKPVADKLGRTMQTQITGKWDNGVTAELRWAGFGWNNDEALYTADIEESVLYITGYVPGEYALQIDVDLAGVSSTITVPITVYETSPLASADVVIDNVQTGLVARYTKQYFDFDLIGEDGEKIYFHEAEITYTAADEDIVAFFEDEAAFMGIANGETDITVSVPAVDFTKTFHITVADAGENLLRTHDGDFEFGEEVTNSIWHWQPGFGPSSSQYKANAWAFGSVHEE